MELDDQPEFTARYLARLDATGITAFQQRSAEISEAHDGRGLAFLCFEPVGEFCHRQLFACWIEQQTGQQVPELAPEEQLHLFG